MYFFVGGFARTGTTLVSNLLCGDSDANPALSEVAYTEYMMFPYEAMMKSWDSNYWRLFDDLDEFQEFHAKTLDLFFQHLMKKHNCKKLVMKRPFLTRWFPVLARLFPESQYIICVRDPRDVAGSLKAVKRRHMMRDLKEQELNPFLDLSLTDMILMYATGVRDCLGAAKHFKDRFHFIKYETLVTEPEQSMKEVGEKLGLELGLKDENWKQQVWHEYNPYFSKGWGKDITDKNIGKYKHQLSEEDLEMVELICSGIMEVFGYG